MGREVPLGSIFLTFCKPWKPPNAGARASYSTQPAPRSHGSPSPAQPPPLTPNPYLFVSPPGGGPAYAALLHVLSPGYAAALTALAGDSDEVGACAGVCLRVCFVGVLFIGSTLPS